MEVNTVGLPTGVNIKGLLEAPSVQLPKWLLRGAISEQGQVVGGPNLQTIFLIGNKICRGEPQTKVAIGIVNQSSLSSLPKTNSTSRVSFKSVLWQG